MDEPSHDGRLIYLLILGFLGSSLLGTVIEPALQPFLWLVLARPLVALALCLLPALSLGRCRPWIVVLSGSAVAAATLDSPEGDATYVLILGLYLVTDIGLDAFYLENFEPRQWVGNGAVLILSRSLGVVFGLLLAALLVLAPEWHLRAVQIQLSVLLLTTLFLKERPGDPRLGLGLRDKGASLDWVPEALRNLREPRTLVAWLRLMAVTALLGLAGADTLPYVVLSLPRLVSWTAAPLEWLAVLVLGCTLAALFGGLKLRRLLVGSLSVFLSAVLAASMPNPSTAAQLGMQITGIVAALACLRAVLASAFEIPPVLRGALFSVSWVLFSLSLVWCTNNLSASASLVLKGVLIGLVGFFVVLAIRQPDESPTSLSPFSEEGDRHRRGEGLHGDKTHDFTAGPEVKRRKKGRYSFRYYFYALTVKFPINLGLIVITAAFLALLLEGVVSREKWREQGRDIWNHARTELFLTSLSHRVREEMLASNKVPRDWSGFVETNFDNVEGRERMDVDFWETPLEFVTRHDEVEIRSAGADREMGTDDDISRIVKRIQGVKD